MQLIKLNGFSVSTGVQDCTMNRFFTDCTGFI